MLTFFKRIIKPLKTSLDVIHMDNKLLHLSAPAIAPSLRWFGTLKILFAIFAIFSYIKPSLLITLIPKNLYLTMHNKII